MSATDWLRDELTKRGVEWSGKESTGGGNITEWECGKMKAVAMEEDDDSTLGLGATHLTPAQAIAATLGSEDAHTREDVESAFVSGFSLGSLPVGSDPQWDENRQTVDEHMAELGWVRAATLGDSVATATRQGDAGTCYAIISDNLTESEGTGDAWADCSECGHLLYVLTDPNSTPPNFCPNCGRRVIEVTE